VLPELSAPVV